MISCRMCSKELVTAPSRTRGIGALCRKKALATAESHPDRISAYTIDIFLDERIVIIHEKVLPGIPRISLTNCIEHVINKIIIEYNLTGNGWAFIEHYDKGGYFGEYAEYDLVELSRDALLWHYLWHSGTPGETQPFSTSLLLERINQYRAGAFPLLNNL